MTDSSVASFSLVIEPRGRDPHAVAAPLIAVQLQALSDLVLHANQRLFGKDARAQIQVSSSPREGSLEIDLNLVVDVLAGARRLLLPDGEDIASRVLRTLGITSTAGVFYLWRKLAGRKPDSVTPADPDPDSGETLVRVRSGALEIKVPEVVYTLSQDTRLVQDGSRFLAGASSDEIRSVAFKKNAVTLQEISSEEARSIRFGYDTPPALASIDATSISQRRVLRPVRVWFEMGKSSTWQLTDGAAKFTVRIRDQDFISKLEAGAVSLSHLTELEVDLRSDTTRSGAESETHYFVDRVVDIRQPSDPQQPLFPAE